MSVAGKWIITIKSPVGPQKSEVILENDNGALTGTSTRDGETLPLHDIKVDGDQVSWVAETTKPMKMKVNFSCTIDGNNLSGNCKPGILPAMPFTGARQ